VTFKKNILPLQGVSEGREKQWRGTYREVRHEALYHYARTVPGEHFGWLAQVLEFAFQAIYVVKNDNADEIVSDAILGLPK